MGNRVKAAALGVYNKYNILDDLCNNFSRISGRMHNVQYSGLTVNKAWTGNWVKRSLLSIVFDRCTKVSVLASHALLTVSNGRPFAQQCSTNTLHTNFLTSTLTLSASSPSTSKAPWCRVGSPLGDSVTTICWSFAPTGFPQSLTNSDASSPSPSVNDSGLGRHATRTVALDLPSACPECTASRICHAVACTSNSSVTFSVKPLPLNEIAPLHTSMANPAKRLLCAPEKAVNLHRTQYFDRACGEAAGNWVKRSIFFTKKN